jgi:hypothetical protein
MKNPKPLLFSLAAVLLIGAAAFVYTHHKAPASSGAAAVAASLPLAPAASATFVSNDTAHEGTWKGTYGSDGYFIHGSGEYSSPSYVSLNIYNGNSDYTWVATTTDTRALERVVGTTRIASSWYTTSSAVGSSYIIDANITDGKAHEITLYALDWDKNGRKQHYVVENATTGAVLDTRSISNFQNGIYTSWTITGHVKILVTNDGPTNAVVDGIFFEPSAAAAGTISGIVFNDVNKNGVYDTGDTPLSGWGVWINANTNGQPDPSGHQILTDANGNYSFSNLVPGTYIVDEFIPTGWTRTLPTTVTSPNTTGYTNVVVMAGQTVTGKNFGSYLGTTTGTTGGGTGTTTTGTGGNGGTGTTGSGATGATCSANTDCASGMCSAGTCIATSPTQPVVTLPTIGGTAQVPPVSTGQAVVYLYSGHDSGTAEYKGTNTRIDLDLNRGIDTFDTFHSDCKLSFGHSILYNDEFHSADETNCTSYHSYNPDYPDYDVDAQSTSGSDAVDSTYNPASVSETKTGYAPQKSNAWIGSEYTTIMAPTYTIVNEGSNGYNDYETYVDSVSNNYRISTINGSYSYSSTTTGKPDTLTTGNGTLTSPGDTSVTTANYASAADFKLEVGGAATTNYSVTLNVSASNSTCGVDVGALGVGLGGYYTGQIDGADCAQSGSPAFNSGPITCNNISIAGVTATSSQYDTTNTVCQVTLPVTGSTTIDVTPKVSSGTYASTVTLQSIVPQKSLIVFLPGAQNQLDPGIGTYGRYTDMEAYFEKTIPNFTANYDVMPFLTYSNDDTGPLITALKNYPNIKNYQHIYIFTHSLGYVVAHDAILNANGMTCSNTSATPATGGTVDQALSNIFKNSTLINISPIPGSGDSPLFALVAQYFLPADSKPDSLYQQCLFSSAADNLVKASTKTAYDYTVSSVTSAFTNLFGLIPLPNPNPGNEVGGDSALDGVWDYMAIEGQGYQCTNTNGVIHVPPFTQYSQNEAKNKIWYNDYENALAPNHVSYYDGCKLIGESNTPFDTTKINSNGNPLETFGNNLHFVLMEYQPLWDAVVKTLEGK